MISADPGAEALALIGLDGEVPDSIVDVIRSVPAVIEARLVRLPTSSAGPSQRALPLST